MSSEEPNGRVTTAQMMTYVTEQLKDLRKEFCDGIDRIESMLTGQRSEYVTHTELDARLDTLRAELSGAVTTSQADRTKLWESVRSLESAMKWGSGAVITAFLGLIVWLIQNH